MGPMGNTCQPRDVYRAKAADRLSPKGDVERVERSGVFTSTGPSSTGEEGDPPASVSPADGTREAPGVVKHLTQPAVKPANAQGVQDVGESEGHPVMGWIGSPTGVKISHLKGC